MTRDQSYACLCAQGGELQCFHSALSLLWWDEETGMPPKALAWRSRQVEAIAAYVHRRFAAPEVGSWIAACEDAPFPQGSVEQANVVLWREEYDRAVKLPAEHVAEEAATGSMARAAWAEARRNNDFAAFLPWLGKQVDLRRRRADFLGYADHPYDALLAEYERGTTTREVVALFDRLRPELAAITAAAAERSRSVPAGLLAGEYPVDRQAAFNREVAEAIGFDFEAGRIDTTTHPFCSRISPGDVRLTTRYRRDDFTESLLGVLHEAGHGLYEQGLPEAEAGRPVGSAVSLGVHESQSRLWENHVGRSRAFWEKWLPRAASYFPHLARLGPADVAAALTRCEPGFIRVGADEASYDLHILLRFGLEVELVAGTLAPRDVPDAWNERFRDLLGLTVPDPAHGCLQDIHWAMGSIGYFATYTLGNLLAAQLVQAARQGDPSLDRAWAAGDFGPLLAWVRQRIHRRGSLLAPKDLVEEATGSPLRPDAFLIHLRNRYLGGN